MKIQKSLGDRLLDVAVYLLMSLVCIAVCYAISRCFITLTWPLDFLVRGLLCSTAALIVLGLFVWLITLTRRSTKPPVARAKALIWLELGAIMLVICQCSFWSSFLNLDVGLAALLTVACLWLLSFVGGILWLCVIKRLNPEDLGGILMLGPIFHLSRTLDLIHDRTPAKPFDPRTRPT